MVMCFGDVRLFKMNRIKLPTTVKYTILAHKIATGRWKLSVTFAGLVLGFPMPLC